ncbi:MAG: glycosyl hydrolase-related protein, partial [Oscillatoriaceae cyanobacterium Prado104]|nr:glycosyl hydrolase-related protein [Oscillatoriaceae cyanobacterium Prado104]
KSDKQPNLPATKTVENLSSIELANLPTISESSPESDVSKSDKQPNLPISQTAENLQPRISATSPENTISKSDNSRNLPDSETAGDLKSIELPKNSPFPPLSPPLPLPIWQDELYLEFHRGCYTTRADQKRQNRRCEELLYQVELLSSLATICTGKVYPKSELETAWKQVLFNQFHDILPGSAIAPVYATANRAFAEADRACRDIIVKSLDAIADRISLPAPPQPDAQPILIFNPLNWSRSEVVAVSLPDAAWQVCDLLGQRLASQIVTRDRAASEFTLLFRATDIPAIGYRIFWLCRQSSQTLNSQTAPTSPRSSETAVQTGLSQVTPSVAPKNAFCQETHFAGARIVLENEFLRATVDGETGNISGIWDRKNNREVLNACGGNQLQAFQDSGQYWDAWNIDPNYQKHQLPAPLLKEIYWVERGEVRQSLRVIRQIGKSEFRQDYIVEIGSPLLKIETEVDWQEQHILVKTAFGLNLAADVATCEIPCGAIERPTRPQTATETAKWEVPILRWTDISDGGFGVSLLNDCKYGCDIQPNGFRLTLLRGSTWPDEAADRGIHEFTCAVYPHGGNWQDAGTVRRGCELNLPLLVKVLPPFEEQRDRNLPAAGSFLDLSADNLILMALKQSEDNSNLWILRCYESEGKAAVLDLKSELGLEIVEAVDLLERPTNLTDQLPQHRSFQIQPWKIASFAVRRATEF